MVSLIFTGDFAPCRRYELLALSQQEAVLGDALGIIRAADVSFVNLECPLTTASTPIRKAGPALKADPLCVEALRSFSVVGLANNHIRDFGEAGIEETIAALTGVGLSYVGAGENRCAATVPAVVERDGFKVGILALAEGEFALASTTQGGAASLDVIENYKQIRALRERVDFVVVTLHAGNEYFPYPRPGLRQTCRFFVDVGADAVICHHPHVPGAYEFYKNKLIVYSVGNLIFDSAKSAKEAWSHGYLVRICVEKEHAEAYETEFIPYMQHVDLEGVRLLGEGERKKFLGQLDSYSKILTNDDAYQKVWADFVASRSNDYLLAQFLPASFRGAGFLARKLGLLRWLVNERTVLRKLNRVQCDSHREVLVAALQRKAKYLGLR